VRIPNSAATRRSPKTDRRSLERRRQRDLAKLHDAWTVLTTGPAVADAAVLVGLIAASAVRS
jgi:hypothetical protein